MKFSSLFSFEFKYKVILFLQKFKSGTFFKDFKFDNNKKKAFFFLAADYGNLGDCAITFAQTKFIQENSDYQVVEIPISRTAEGYWFVKKNITTNDIIVTVGGGNMGEMYNQIEFLRQLVFKSFRKNKIISFPQTFDFSKSEDGQKSLRKAQKVYNSHPNLHLVAREKTSYASMKKYFDNAKVYITPDIVLSLKLKDNFERKGAILCMRADDEKKLSSADSDNIEKLMFSKFGNVEFYDTHIGKDNLNQNERVSELNKIWEKFSNAELVITDRLHGMIFCHITGTQAIVFQNSNHKVAETFDWIKDNTSVVLLKDFSQQAFRSLLDNKTNKKSSLDLSQYYKPLIDLLN